MKTTQKKSVKPVVSAPQPVFPHDRIEVTKGTAWIVLNWVLLLVAILAGYFFFKWFPLKTFFADFPTLSGMETIVFGLSLAFGWVEVMKWGSVKPFNCLKCMSGWFTLIVAVLFHVDAWYLYLPVGVFVGALFDRIKGRYL